MGTEQINNNILWSYIRGSDTIDIKLGYSCNNYCIHCVVDPIREELLESNSRMNVPTQEIINQIEAASCNGFNSIVLTGGEPTLRKDFIEIAQFACDKGLRILLQTNARKLSNWELCRKLEDIEDILYIIAIHSNSADVHDEITRVKGSFNETVSAIQNLLKMGKAISTKIVLSNLNYRHLLATIKFVEELGVRESSVAFPHALGFPKNRFEVVVPYYRLISEQIKATAIWSEENNFWVDFETIPFCICPRTQSFWKRNCDLYTKVNFPHYREEEIDLSSSQLPDWEYIRPRMKCKAANCAYCFFNKLCEGPWIEYVETRGIHEFIPINDPTVLSLIN